MGNIGIFREFQKLCEHDRAPNFDLITELVQKGIFLTENQFYYFVDYKYLKIISVSKSIEKVLGISPEEFSIKSHMDSIHPDDIKLVHTIAKRAHDWFLSHTMVSLETVFIFEYRIKHASGQYIKVNRKTIVFDMGLKNTLLMTVGIMTDIDGIKKDNLVRYDVSGSDTKGFNVPEVDKIHRIEVAISDRELEVLLLMTQGLSSKEISEKLSISKVTVDDHRRNMLKKTGMKNSVELIVFGVRNNLI
ncbi:LuxR C-terminal-related transcriptional regulator [Flammeovirgaceae bacterium SG7u.111]|nr:LuxR C-terminal-related transcriptional regulator [Flammeovirgaceae bacterium SG7u.132]WPO35263.1 LuxR C-terminal-related transcriptional regulator [Flammeovirgaceae bacterium SG7u.111]